MTESAAPDVLETTLADWRISAGRLVLIGAALAFVLAGSAASGLAVMTVVKILFLALVALSLVQFVLDARSGRGAEEPPALVGGGKVAVVLTLVFGALGAVLGAVVGVAAARFGSGTMAEVVPKAAFAGAILLGGTVVLVAVNAATRRALRRWLRPRAGAAPAPDVWITAPRSVLLWSSAAIVLGSASVAMGVLCLVDERPHLRIVAAALLAASVGCGFRRRALAKTLGAPRRFVR